MSVDERPRGSARPTRERHHNSLPRTSLEAALGSASAPHTPFTNGTKYSTLTTLMAEGLGHDSGLSRTRWCIG